MPEIPTNYVAVLLGAIASMILGFLWYGPLFGKQWMKLSGIKMPTKAEMKKMNMNKYYAMAFVGALLTSYVMAHSLIFASEFLGIDGLSAGLQAGFWNWLGFAAPITLSSVLWEGKPWKLWILNNCHLLSQFLMLGAILSLLPA